MNVSTCQAYECKNDKLYLPPFPSRNDNFNNMFRINEAIKFKVWIFKTLYVLDIRLNYARFVTLVGDKNKKTKFREKYIITNHNCSIVGFSSQVFAVL